MDLYLASTSPRRSALLRQAGIAFELCEPGPEHVEGETGAPAELARARARRKARGARIADRSIAVLGVDTVVDLGGRELGKPRDEVQAREMLMALAGGVHLVHTGHCLVRLETGEELEEVASATVAVRLPDAAELERYLASREWVGKAGSYGIQDPSQSFFRLLAGAFDTVVGLHVPAVRRLLAAGMRS